MRLEKLTTKFQEALGDAQSLALGNDNAYIEPIHLLAAMLRQQDGPKALLERAGAKVGAMQTAVENAIKALPITVVATRPIDEAISTAGGVTFEALDAHLMAQTVPGLFCAGEMLDWEAPTGGYLLTACLASGVRAGQGVLAFLGRSA